MLRNWLSTKEKKQPKSQKTRKADGYYNPTYSPEVWWQNDILHNRSQKKIVWLCMVFTPNSRRTQPQLELDGKTWNVFSFQKSEVASLNEIPRRDWGARVADSEALLCEIPNPWGDYGKNGQENGRYQDSSCHFKIRQTSKPRLRHRFSVVPTYLIFHH